VVRTSRPPGPAQLIRAAVFTGLLLTLAACAQPAGVSTPVDAAVGYVRALGAGDTQSLREVAFRAPDEQSIPEERQRLFGSPDEFRVADIEVFDEVRAEPDGETMVAMFVTTEEGAKHEVNAFVRSTNAETWAVFSAMAP